MIDDKVLEILIIIFITTMPIGVFTMILLLAKIKSIMVKHNNSK